MKWTHPHVFVSLCSNDVLEETGRCTTCIENAKIFGGFRGSPRVGEIFTQPQPLGSVCTYSEDVVSGLLL